MQKNRYVLWLITLVLLGLVIVLYNPVRTLTSLTMVADYPLYVMHYYGNYETLKQWGIDRRISQMLDIQIIRPGGSSTFVAQNPEGYAVLARNFSLMWDHSPVLLLFTHPPDGHDSVSLVPLDLMGFEGNEIPWRQKWRLLLSPFFSMDGMNEHGLVVAINSVPCRMGDYNPDLPVMKGSQLNRLILDNAINVDQVVNLLEGYNLHFSGACGHHQIADTFGNAAIIEYIDGRNVIIRSQEYWQVATNFLVSEFQADRAAPCWRYNHAYEELRELNGKINSPRAMHILEEISSGSNWSVVYNLMMGDIDLVLGDDYSRRYSFHHQMDTQYKPWFTPSYISWLQLTN
jgi:hypothetical protein